MFSSVVKSPLFAFSALVVSASTAIARRNRDTPSSIVVRAPEYLDKWNFITEFNNLCTGIYPDDISSLDRPVLSEVSVEPTKLAQESDDKQGKDDQQEDENPKQLVIQARSIPAEEEVQDVNEEGEERYIDYQVEEEVKRHFVVSCLYTYPDGENHQLGSYIAEQLGGRIVNN